MWLLLNDYFSSVLDTISWKNNSILRIFLFLQRRFQPRPLASREGGGGGEGEGHVSGCAFSWRLGTLSLIFLHCCDSIGISAAPIRRYNRISLNPTNTQPLKYLATPDHPSHDALTTLTIGVDQRPFVFSALATACTAGRCRPGVRYKIRKRHAHLADKVPLFS